MPATYTIRKVHDNPRSWQSKQGGPMVSYKVDLDGPNGRDGVEWSRREGSAMPVVGQRVEGEIEQGNYGPKLKVARPAGTGFGGGGFRPRDPKETAAIQRQHSQEMALRFLDAVDLGEATLGKTGKQILESVVRPLIDWFQRDIEDGVRLAEQPGYGQPPKTREPVRTGESDVPGDGSEFVHPQESLEGTPING